jgi:hypothetical protein
MHIQATISPVRDTQRCMNTLKTSKFLHYPVPVLSLWNEKPRIQNKNIKYPLEYTLSYIK